MTKNNYYMYKQAQMDFSFIQPAPDDPNRFAYAHQMAVVPEVPKKPSILDRLKNWFKSKKTETPEQVRPEDCIPLPADAWHGGGIGM